MTLRFKASMLLFVQWQLIPKIIALYLNDLIELNKLTRNSSIFAAFDVRHSLHSSFSIGTVRFGFRDDLVDFLDRLNSTDVVLRLLNFTSVRNPLFLTSLPLFIDSDDSKIECVTDQVSELYLTQSCHVNELKRNRHILHSLAIRFQTGGYFSICAHLGSSIDTSHLIESHQCLNFNVEANPAEIHQFRYKPLFIVIMYMLCGLVLTAISFGKYLLHRHKLVVQKKVNQSSGIKSRSDVSLYREKEKTDSIEKTVDSRRPDREPLLSKIQSCDEFDNEPLAKSNSRVLFQVNSVDSIKQEEVVSQVENRSKHEADHILNDKPWLRTTIDNASTMGGSLDKLESQIVESSKLSNRGENGSIERKKKTTTNTSNLVSTKPLNKSIVVYESNV